MAEPREPSLTLADRNRIEAAVRAAEALTSAEIVVAIDTEPCEEHDATVALIAAAVLAILSAGPLSHFDLSLEATVIGQLAAFALFTAFAVSSRVRRALRIDRLPTAAAHEAAERAFVELGLGRTRARTGVLIHVALVDRRVEVIADEGVHEAVAPETWQDYVDEIVAAAKAGRLTDGVVAAVERCGAALADALPPQPGLGDELPNAPVTR